MLYLLYFSKGIGNTLLILSYIIAFIAKITYLISCVFAGYITYDFFANNNVVTYTYYGLMLGLVIVLIIVHFVPLAIAAILIVILVCLIIIVLVCWGTMLGCFFLLSSFSD